MLKKRTSLQDENERLQRDLQEILQAHAAEQPAIQQISQECAELESEINQLNKQQAIMRHEIGELKARNNEIRDDATSLHFTILEADKEIERLQSKIVNSPDRVKKVSMYSILGGLYRSMTTVYACRRSKALLVDWRTPRRN